MTDEDAIIRLTLLLDAAIPALNAAARAEEKREAGKRLKQITEQQRSRTAATLVAEMSMKYGIPL